jgi:phosphinothricin acetyltransferase
VNRPPHARLPGPRGDKTLRELVIRPAERGDLPRLTEIYNYYIRETAITFEVEPYTVEGRRPWLEQFSGTGRYRILVAVADGRTIGWANSQRFRERAAYDPTVETSIYLDPESRGQRVGTRLYAALFELLRGEDLHRAIAGITLPNEASEALHRKVGFQPVGVMHEVGRKFDRWWDVGWLQKPLS